jgi:mRNA-degrading endonuclease RelE of RelBE toxin-antitoxin system
LRVGEWRVLLKVEREAGNLYILRIRHRREAYRRR